jgi:hypothetical protein
MIKSTIFGMVQIAGTVASAIDDEDDDEGRGRFRRKEVPQKH